MTTNYSIILPIKNEAESLPQLLEEIKQTMQTVILSEPSESKDHKYEILAIDDASTDNSLITLNSLTSQIPQLKIIHFNFPQGKWAGLRAGFNQAMGNIIITMDSDLQDDPGDLPKLLSKLEQAYDLVSGARVKRFDPFYKVAISRLGNWLVSKLSGRHFKDLNSPFKLYKRDALDQIPKEGSLLRFSMLFAQKLGYKVCEVPINQRPRFFGKSKFGVVKYLRIIYDLILVLLLFSGSGRIRSFRDRHSGERSETRIL